MSEKKAPFLVLWDNGVEACGGIECWTEDEANRTMITILEGWIESCLYDIGSGEYRYCDSAEEAWDSMIDNASVCVAMLDDRTGDYDYDHEEGLDDETLAELGWVYWAERNGAEG